MKRIIALIREERAEEMLVRLSQIGMSNASMTDVDAIGPQTVDPESGKVSLCLGRMVRRMKRVEFFSPDKHAETCLAVVLAAADTNQPGAGIVSISPVEKLVKINGKVTLEG